MALSDDLISQFVKVTKDEVEPKNETTVYGKIVNYEGSMYVQLDGSDLLTPISSTADVKPDERVTVMIKDHTATVYGNVSSPSASSKSVEEIGARITEAEILIADKVSTVYFDAQVARIDSLTTDNANIKERLTASEADIDTLEADNVTINQTLTAHRADIDDLNAHKLSATDASITYATIESLNATNATVHNLQADYGDFKSLSTDKFTATEADIKDLQANKLSAADIQGQFATIDFANIGKAAIENFFSKSGMISDLVVGEGTVTGKLVGVTIIGDLIEGGTVKADKLVVKGTDGLYYKLNTDGVKTETEQTEYNSINGSVILAKSITATKIDVKDLVAFGATIGGFHITDDAIYSGVKETLSNTTAGLYFNKDGQIVIGDASNYIKYYKGDDNKHTLEISADSILLGSEKKSIETMVDGLDTRVTNAETSIQENSNAIELKATMTEVSELVEDNNSTINENIANQGASITDSCKSMISEALTTYTQTGDFEAFRKTTEASLKLLSDQMKLQFTEEQEQLESINNSLQNQLNTITKYFTFDVNGLTIGQVESPYKVIIDNDRYSMTVNDVEVMWIANGKVYTPEIEVTSSFKLLDYLISKDSSGNVNCEYVGGD